ncbi:MAG: hypothetical protein ACEPO8_03405 [Rhodothermaceae bacterium]
MEFFRKNIAKNISHIEDPEIYALNRWLNSFPVNECEIDDLPESVNRFTSVNTQIPSARVPYGIFFYQGENDNKNAYITFNPVETLSVPCQIASPEVEFVEFSLFNFYLKKYNPFTFDEVNEIPDIKLKKLKALVYKVDFPQEHRDSKIQKIDFHENVSENLINDACSSVLHNTIQSLNKDENKGKSPQILHNLQVNFSENESEKPENPDENSTINSPTHFLPEENLIADPVYNPEHRKLIRYLEPVYELTPELRAELLANLPDYQKTGTEFLYDNDFVFFNDSFELGKETQSVAALRMLLRTRKIQKVLIVTNEYNNKIYKQNPLICLKGLWQSILELLLNEYDFKFHNELSDLDKKNIFSNYIINGISYNTFEKSFNNGLFSHEELNLFDCIIFDDTTLENLNLGCISLLEENAYKNKLWFLSEFTSTNLSEKIAALFPQRKLMKFGRNGTEIDEINNKTFPFDFYLPLEEHNTPVPDNHIFAEEPATENALLSRSEQVKLVKKLQQQPYCKDHDNCSKTGLLVHHLERILNQNNRVVVYTQADSGKIDEIEKILQAYNFNYLKFNQRDPELNVVEKLSEIENDTETKFVYLTNMDPQKAVFIFPEVSHIINFDNSWNPLRRWQLERTVENPLVIYNYFYENSIEHELISELAVKGFFDRNLIKTLSCEKLYNAIDNENINAGEIKNIEIKSVIQLLDLTKELLTKLGYDTIKSKAGKVDLTYDLSAKSSLQNLGMNVKLIFSEHINSQQINQIINGKDSENPLLIITNGTLSHSKVLLPPDVSLVNGKLLLDYLACL